MTLRVAFIGAGRMAGQHLRVLRRLPSRAVVAGVCDRAPERAEALAARAGARAFGSVDALLAHARPDVVHVCTPPAAHFEAARAALEAGAHVYVEKPFALTADDARALLDLADARGRLVCAGHQLLRDRAFATLVARSPGLGTPVQVDSHFAFRPSGASADGRGEVALAGQLIDILPHPLYSLVWLLDHLAPGAASIDLLWADADATDLHAGLRAGRVIGRLSVSLRARPVASVLTLAGTDGALTCDFVRSVVVGAANPGTEALEKVLNPMIEGAQLVGRTAASLARRIGPRAAYPGLAVLIGEFYRAVGSGAPSPVPPAHLLRVTALFEALAARVETAVRRTHRARFALPGGPSSPLVVVTGASGFLGREIARVMPRVRGIGRSEWPGYPPVHSWVAADLGEDLQPGVLADADVVVHAAAETAGGFPAQQRNTIDATRHLLHAMRAAGVTRLVLVSSLSVLRPPRSPREMQDERTPRPRDPRPLGAYTWGKCEQEALVEREAAALGIATRVVRPGALVDWRHPVLPALMGRRLFGRWHLCLGRPRLPIAVCDVERCAEAIAWIAAHFDDAPPLVNLFDPAVTTRGVFVARLRERRWRGRVLWVPIGLVASGLIAARALAALVRGRWPGRLAAWSVLRPRRHDARAAAALFETIRRDAEAAPRAGVEA